MLEVVKRARASAKGAILNCDDETLKTGQEEEVEDDDGRRLVSAGLLCNLLCLNGYDRGSAIKVTIIEQGMDRRTT